MRDINSELRFVSITVTQKPVQLVIYQDDTYLGKIFIETTLDGRQQVRFTSFGPNLNAPAIREILGAIEWLERELLRVESDRSGQDPEPFDGQS